jgi:Bacterial PH domain
MTNKYTKLNERFGLIEFPVSLDEMEQISLEFPKTERTYYEYAIKALRKVMKKDEKIYSFTSADSAFTKTGFMVVAEKNLIFVNLTFGFTGGAVAEVVKYKDIKSVDFDIIPSPFGQMETGVILLEMKGLIGTKKRTIRNIPEYNLDSVLNAVRNQVHKHSSITK